MTLDAASLGAFGDLAVALGILEPGGSPNAAWFEDPMRGGGPAGHGLTTVMADPGQRQALLDFVDDVLGSPDASVRDGATWVPLFDHDVAGDPPHVTVYAVVRPVGSETHLGVAVSHQMSGAAPRVDTRLHVPLFRFAGRTGSLGPGETPWLLLGRDGGEIELSVDATLLDTAPPAGQPGLGGVAATLRVPTDGSDVGFGIDIRDLQLPGTSHPRSFELAATSPDELGSDLVELLGQLLRQQAEALASDPDFAPFAALAGMLGLREVPGIRAFPIADLPTRGIDAVVDWLTDLLRPGPSQTAWLGQLATLVDGDVDADRSAVTLTVGALTLAIGVRVATGSGSHPVLVPWVEASLATQAPAPIVARASVDLLRADTGTGRCTAIPDARVEAVFGSTANKLVGTTSSPTRVDSLRVGLGLDAQHRPTFVLVAQGVRINGAAGDPVQDLDLSSPQAALESVGTVLDQALDNLIDGLDDAADLVRRALGLTPPAGIAGVTIPQLLADPVGALRGFWERLLEEAAATREVLEGICHLVAGSVEADTLGGGERGDPWSIELVGPLRLEAWIDPDSDAEVLHLDLALQAATPVLDDYTATTALALAAVTIEPRTGNVDFATGAHLRTSLARADGTTARLGFADMALVFESVSVELRWRSSYGLRPLLAAPGLVLSLPRPADPFLPFSADLPLPLPELDADGRFVLDAGDWRAVEGLLAALVHRLGVTGLSAAVDLLGWTGKGARLDLAGLLTGDAVATLEAWLADLVLDCDRIAWALGPVASLLSGFRISRPFGTGNAADPWRCPVAGAPRAPGLRVWVDPGCAVRPDKLGVDLGALVRSEPPEPDDLVEALRGAARVVPDLDDLLVGRESLASGFQGLADRWQQTDGVVGLPALPDGLQPVVFEGLGYDTLLALGTAGGLLGQVLPEVAPELHAAVVHVACESAEWLEGRPAGSTFDLTAPAPGQLPSTDPGPWFVRLPTPEDAAAARPDLGAVGAQAQLLEHLLGVRATDVVVVGYGAAGAAAVRVAGTRASVAHVVTVGTPWGSVSTDALRSGHSGDALRLLGRLHRPGANRPPEPLVAYESTPLQRMRGIIARAQAALRPGALPDASLEARSGTFEVHPVFGSLTEKEIARGLGAFVADAIRSRLEARAMPSPGAVTRVHVGLDLPVLDLDIGGALVGVGLAVELCAGERGPGGALELEFVRGVTVDLHLGVVDGWLVGGPGSTTGAGDLRWMSARVDVPLDGRPGSAELVLHEATGLGIDRERWVVNADPLSRAVPEVRLLLSSVMTRLAADVHMGTLLELLGLRTGGGLDPAGLDRLLLDTSAFLRGRVAAAPAALAAELQHFLDGQAAVGSALSWTAGPATVGIDLRTGAVDVVVDFAPEGTPVRIGLHGSPAWATADVAVGALDPVRGGVRLVASTPAATGQRASARLEVAVPSRPTRLVDLWPEPDVDGLGDVAALLVPSLGLEVLADAVLASASDAARADIATLLGHLGVMDAGEHPRVRIPVAAVADPAGWLLALVRAGTGNPAQTAVAALDLLRPLVAEPSPLPGWQVVDGVRLSYAALGQDLRVTLDVDIELDLGTTAVTSTVRAGVVVAPGAPPRPAVEASLGIEGMGLAIGLDPDLRISLLRLAPTPPLQVYPEGPGLGELISTAATSLVPVLLNEVAGMTGTWRGDVAALVRALGDALQLREGGSFTAAAVNAFAADPAAALQARLPALVTTAASALVAALVDSPGSALVGTRPPPPGATAAVLTFGAGPDPAVVLTITADGTPSVDIAASWTIPDLGPVVVESLRLSAAGVDVSARLGPFPVEAGPCVLRPVVAVRAGSAAGSARMLGVGLALNGPDPADPAASYEELAVELRWALDSTPPALHAVTRTGATVAVGAPNDPEAGIRLLSQAIALVGGVLVDALDPLLDAHPRIEDVLEGVLFSSGRTIDATFATDLVDPDALLARLQRLLWNATEIDLALTVDVLTIGLAASSTGNDRQLGLRVSLPPGTPFMLPTSGVKIGLEVDDSWLLADVDGGITVYGVRGVKTGDDYAFTFEPGVTVAGVGVRFTNEAGPLLDLGGVISLDGIALHIYAEATSAGVGGGAQLELQGFSFAPSGNGDNPVASGIMSDAGSQASPSTRPSFSPAIAVQKPPDDDGVRVSVRAGPPPGPWWLLVQRQLGPLYLERFGFNSTEAGGEVTSVSLLFDGRVEIFGLTAAVDQLSITWDGDDPTSVDSWSVDLMGLAISADMGGIVLAGGLLKTVVDGNPGYVGMLLGRFGIYGLSVFGGYTSLDGDPSFFVFGAVNGPIGGPPAFFVTGIGGGLGINRRLVIPDDPAQFPQYPFIVALDPNADFLGDPMARLRELNTFFGPELGTFWFAGGISFTCFSLVDGIAVVAVSFGKAGLEINLMGLARMALPRPQAALVSIELGLLARFSTIEGVFMIRAALTDNSWLLYPEVRLTGGFAFALWWKGPLSGQFVLTIGGYHPDFHRDGYPVVPRLGLMWRVTDEIYVKGESFFALTSEALMAGVQVIAVADFGWAWAKADFGAMGLVYFDPFYFCVEAWARVSAGIDIETWFGDISISITLGARVKVEGPKFRGEVEVEVGPCTVTVPFGDRSDKRTPKLEWDKFVQKYLEEAGPGIARVLTGITGKGSLPAATGGGQSVPTPDGSLERPFDVYAEFEITFTTTVPTSTFDTGPGADVPVAVTRSDGAAASLGLKPMGRGDLSSTFRLTLTKEGAPGAFGSHAGLERMQEGREIRSGSFPMGVWAKPDRPLEQSPALPTGDVINAGNLLRLEARAVTQKDGPEIDYYRVEAGRRPLPLQQTPGIDRQALLDLSAGVALPDVDLPETALRFAEEQLFLSRAAVVDGLQPNGVRSATAKAGYRKDVAAPPLLGTLADGLAVRNDDDATASEQDPVPEAQAPAPRQPRVVGYLTGGTRVAARSGRTTVTGSEVKRRPAPTLVSARARMTRRFPVHLDLVGTPAAKIGRTITPTSLPFTAVTGSARSWSLATGPAADRVAGLSGLGGAAPKGVRAAKAAGVAKAVDGTPTLASGDLVALQLPDHGADAAAGRPSLDLNGTGRLVCLRGDGRVLRDVVAEGAQEVPEGTELVVVQADGTVSGPDGLAGWHLRSRVAAVGSGTGIAAGCVLDVEQPDVLPGVAWTSAGDLIRGARAVTTTFSSPVDVVVLVVEVSDPERVGDLGLELRGANRATKRGETVEPTLIVNGAQSVAVYPVVPDGDGLPVTVAVRSGGGWSVTGVLGSAGSAAEVAAAIGRNGVVAATGRLLAIEGAGCSPAWTDGTAPKRVRPKRGGGRGR